MIPWRWRWRWRTAALSLLATAALVLPSSALADCAERPPIDQVLATADIVFVGTVTATTNQDRRATVTVEEVWRGPDLPVSLTVIGGPDANSATSIDRTFQIGVKYLFFPYQDADIGFHPGALELVDNSCSLTTPWTADLALHRPAVTRPPVAIESGSVLGGLVGPVVAALVVAAALLGIGLVARGRHAD